MSASQLPLIESFKTIREAMEVIDAFAKRTCFVTENKKLVGVATDGDIRRALMNGIVLGNQISSAMNKTFVAHPITADDNIIRSSFSSRIKLIPLLGENGEVLDVADSSGNYLISVLEPFLGGNERDYVKDCIDTNWISSQGKYVSRFEEMFEQMHPNTCAIAVSNGTVALHLALAVLGVGEGDEVIVPDLTFAATINAVLHCRATPVICEINPDSWCIEPGEVEKLINSKTKAIIPVHLYGQPCDMDRLVDIALRYDLFLVEDCAEALGSEWKGKVVGTFGDAAIFSFFGNKTISTGEGGMILFRDPEVGRKSKIMRDHGMSPSKRYWHEVIGYNYRLTNLQAAIGVAQMERFETILDHKLRIADIYKKYLANVQSIVQLPQTTEHLVHSNWLFTIRLAEDIDRDKVIKKMLERGVDTRPVFYPMHQMPPYKQYPKSSSLENSSNISQSGISLPTSVKLTERKIENISSSLLQVLNE